MSYSLGNAVTNHFLIGSFELRVGPLYRAGKLSSEQSVGLVEAFNLNSQINTTTLSASFPRKIVDSAVVSSISSFGITLREYSARNLRMLMGEGISEYSSVTPFYAEGAVTTAVKPSGSNIRFQHVTADSYLSSPVSLTISKNSTGAADITASTISANPSFTYASGKATTNADKTVRISGFLNIGSRYALSLTVPQNSKATTVTVSPEKGDIVTESSADAFVKGAVWQRFDATTNKITFGPGTGTATKTVLIFFTANTAVVNFTIGISAGYTGTIDASITEQSSPLVAGDTVSLVNVEDASNPIITEVISFNNSDATSLPGLTVKNVGRDITANTRFKISRCVTVGAGNMDTNKRFFTASLIHLDRSGKIPLIYDFWKCSLESGMDLSVDVGQFSSTQLQVKVLKPTLADTSANGVLAHVADDIALSPTWRYSSLPVGS